MWVRHIFQRGDVYTKKDQFHSYFGASQHHLSRRSSTRTTVWTKWTPATPSARKTIWFERVVHVTNCDDSWVVLRKSLAAVVIVVTWAPPSTWVDWFLKRSVHTYCYGYRSWLTLDRHWTYFQHRLSIFQGFESPINRMWRPPHFSVWLYLCLKQVIQLPWGCSSFTLVVENRKYKPWLETEAFIPLLFFFFLPLSLTHYLLSHHKGEEGGGGGQVGACAG